MDIVAQAIAEKLDEKFGAQHLLADMDNVARFAVGSLADLAGYPSMARAMKDPLFATYLDVLVEEMRPAYVTALQWEDIVGIFHERFVASHAPGNPGRAADGRVGAALDYLDNRAVRHRRADAFTLGLAAWIRRFRDGRSENGVPLAFHLPAAPQLRKKAKAIGDDPLRFFDGTGLLGRSLGRRTLFTGPLAEHWAKIRRKGGIAGDLLYFSLPPKERPRGPVASARLPAPGN